MIWPEGFEHEHRNWLTWMGSTCYSSWFSLMIQVYMPGHVTLGTAHSAGPTHLTLISLCSSLLLYAVWWVRVWFCQTCHVARCSNKGEEGQPAKNCFKNPTAQAWALIPLPGWVDGSAWTIRSVFLFPVSSTYSLCWWIRPGSGNPHREEERVAVNATAVTWRMWGVQIHYLSIIYIPLSLCNCKLHQHGRLSYCSL